MVFLFFCDFVYRVGGTPSFGRDTPPFSKWEDCFFTTLDLIPDTTHTKAIRLIVAVAKEIREGIDQVAVIRIRRIVLGRLPKVGVVATIAETAIVAAITGGQGRKP